MRGASLMFSKILIANRGEIACRVIKTARKMGIATVAVYSDADVRALHVQMADEAVNIGAPQAAQSYLVSAKIIDACKATGAEAVHPGYGFLSENAVFAKELEDAGIAFIGPNVRAIEVMGDKIASKKFAEKSRVNTVPGDLTVIADAAHALEVSEKIGFPVMIKASAGGGGKGMRVAHGANEVAEGFAAAVSEAKASFGDDRIFIEKFIEHPRHIEIQVLADSHGNTIYLGERECSIQRRNQKVIEEAPSPFLDEETRSAMGEQSVALAKAVEYRSAGTVEFIVDKDRNFYFLEMNTRLQVEHPVTELITGIDLVEQMIKIAAGEKLNLKQSDVKLNGWAIESRIYAEDPYREFLPSTGRLIRYQPPEETTQDGITVRNDTGVYEGGEISVYYDPMIAKLCTHAQTREQAIAAMGEALNRFIIDGIEDNIPFLASLMRHPRWIKGDISTGFIAEEYPDGFGRNELPDDIIRTLMVAAASIDQTLNLRKRKISGQVSGEKVTFSTKRVVVIEDKKQPISIEYDGDRLLRVIFEAANDALEMGVNSGWTPGQALWQAQINGSPVVVQVRPIVNGHRLTHQGAEVEAYVYTRREAELAALMPVKVAPDTSKMLLCPMPGQVVSIDVKEGDQVKPGDKLCIVEAMKMENILRAERDCIVENINCAAGDTLGVDDVMMTFE